MSTPERLPNGLTPEQDAAMDRLAEAIVRHATERPSPTLAEFAAAVEAAKRGEHLPESDAWLEANARTRPDWRDDSAAEDIVRDRIEQRIDVDPRGDDRAADLDYERRNR